MTWTSGTASRLTLAVGVAVALATPAGATSATMKITLSATGADTDATGSGRLKVRDRRGALSGLLELRARRLDSRATYQVTIDGVAVGSLTSARSGKGRARFRTNPANGRDQLLGVDPRGRAIALLGEAGAVVLTATVGTRGLDPNDVRCCLPDDSGPECEDRTAAECAAEGGIDMGPGSCLPDPCDVSAPAPGTDVVCCLPDDSGPECEDRTPAQCAALGGINLGAGACVPNPCTPVGPAPGTDVRCCLPDDSGPECEGRTAAECQALGGVNIGTGSCLPNPCKVGSTSTTLPGGGAPAVVVTCERRADRSRASVNGKNLASGNYKARLTSGGNSATSGLAATIGDEVELDFDSEPDDVAAGATAIGAGFLQGAPPQATGEILDAADQVVVSTTVTCVQR